MADPIEADRTVAEAVKRVPVVEVNGEVIYADEVRLMVATRRAQAEASGRDLQLDDRTSLRQSTIQELIDQRLMRQEARRMKLFPTEAEVDEALEAIAPKYDGTAGCRADAADAESRQDTAERLMVDRLIDRWLAAVRPPKGHEVREVYRRNAEHFVTPEMIHASHIVKNAAEGEDDGAVRQAVEAARESILAGADFAETARQVSDCGENGGDLGFFPRGVMVDEFDEVAFATEPGAITEPFRTPFGWHIVLVRERRAAGVREFEEVAPQIQQRMTLQRQEYAVMEKLSALRVRARIVDLEAR